MRRAYFFAGGGDGSTSTLTSEKITAVSALSSCAHTPIPAYIGAKGASSVLPISTSGPPSLEAKSVTTLRRRSSLSRVGPSMGKWTVRVMSSAFSRHCRPVSPEPCTTASA